MDVVTAPRGADRAAIEAFLDAVAAATGRPPLTEARRNALARAGAGAAGRGGRLVGLGVRAGAPGPDGRSPMVGYAQVDAAGDAGPWAVELAVAPGAGPAVADALLDRAVAEVAAAGGGTLRLWVSAATAVDDARAVAHGFVPERDLLQMRCALPLPPGGPEAVAGGILRPFRPGRDETAWLALNNRAFAGHPEQGHWDAATLADRQRAPWFDPDGFLLLEEDGRLTGWCWTKIHAETSPPVGEIYVIGVDPEAQGGGRGRYLTRAGFAWLSGRGLRRGMLYVDAANSSAVALYRSLGMTVDHVDRAYLTEVAEAAA